MFKDIYKAACDDIKPDPYLIGKIIDKSQCKSRPVYFRYAFSACAAAIALAVMIPTFLNNSGTNIMNSDVTPPKNAVRNIVQTEIAPAPIQNSSETIQDTTPAPAYVADEVVKPEPKEENSAPSGSLESVIHVIKDNTKDNQIQTPVVMSVNNISENIGIAGAYSRHMMLSDDFTEIEYEEMSVNDYFNYIGFSPDKLEIPEGLTADYDSSAVVTIEKTDNGISSDAATFTFSGDSFVSVTTSTNSENVSAVLENEEYEKTQIGENSVVVTFDGSVYQGYYITPEGTAVTITSVDLTEEQFEKLIISATE